MSKNKHFVAALKSNRLIALSPDDKKQGRFVKVSELDLSDQQGERSYLKGFEHEVLIVRRVFLQTKTAAPLYGIWFAVI